jgi:hypothetical protein
MDLSQHPRYDLEQALAYAAELGSRRVDITTRVSGTWESQPFSIVVKLDSAWQDANVPYGLLIPPEPTGNVNEYVVYRHRNEPLP